MFQKCKSSALYSIELRAFEISAFIDVRCFDWSHNEPLKWTSPVQFSELILSSLRWWVKVNSSILWRYLGCYFGAFHITAYLAAIWSIFLNAVEFGSSLQAKFIWKFDNFLVAYVSFSCLVVILISAFKFKTFRSKGLDINHAVRINMLCNFGVKCCSILWYVFAVDERHKTWNQAGNWV